MACGERETITISYWTVCWEWGFIPYPCKKTKQETRYEYDFRPWRTRFSWVPFRRTYQGCCGGALFQWSYWTWSPFGTGNGPWVDTEYIYFSDGVIGSIGNCPFDGGVLESNVPLNATERLTAGSFVTPGVIAVAAALLINALLRANRRSD